MRFKLCPTLRKGYLTDLDTKGELPLVEGPQESARYLLNKHPGNRRSRANKFYKSLFFEKPVSEPSKLVSKLNLLTKDALFQFADIMFSETSPLVQMFTKLDDYLSEKPVNIKLKNARRQAWNIEVWQQFQLKLLELLNTVDPNDYKYDHLSNFNLSFHKKLLAKNKNSICLIEETDNYVSFEDFSNWVLAIPSGADLVPEGPLSLPENIDKEKLNILQKVIKENLYTTANYFHTNKVGEINKTPVFSNFSPTFLASINLNLIPKLPFQYKALNLNKQESLHPHNFKAGSPLLSATGVFSATESSDKIAISIYSNNSTDLSVADADTVLKAIQQASWNNTQGPLDSHLIFHIPSWATSRAKGTPEFKTVSTKFVSKRKGIFYPVLYSAKYLDENKNINPCYFLCFILLDSRESLFKHFLINYAAASKAFASFLHMYSYEGGIYFKNQDLYREKITEKILSFSPWASKEHFQQWESYSNTFELASESRSDSWNRSLSERDALLPFDEGYTSLISSQKVENQHIEKKLTKILNKISNASLPLMKEIACLRAQNDLSIKYHYRLLQAHLITVLDSNLAKASNRQGQPCLLAPFVRLQKLNSVQNQLNEENESFVLKSIDSSRHSKDESLYNLLKDEIKILKITYAIGDEETLTISSLTSKATLLKTHLSGSKIFSVEFETTRPVKINVDGIASRKKPKAAGPYMIEAKRDVIRIKCKDKKSLFGVDAKGTHRFFTHPHSGRTSDPFKYSRACLGEASPLIYAAFEKNCLKTILLSVMIWVKSANSSDTWGRNYKFFMDYECLDFNKEVPAEQEQAPPQDDNTITEEEVGDFFASFAEDILPQEPIEGLGEISPRPPFQPPQAEQNIPQTSYQRYSEYNLGS